MTTIRPKQHKFLSVDFVTALPLEDCRASLLSRPPVDGIQITIQDDNSFAIQHAVSPDQLRMVRFWGTLEVVQRGTWVWGTIIETSAGSRRSTYGWGLLIAILFIMVVQAGIRDNTQMVLTLVMIILTMLILLAAWWRWRHRHGLALLSWVYETLYVAPEREPSVRQT
ncbi:MAG: hypothetical protein HY866_07820 [Chloroflexi bacterium]|nr:hypothetical protein [Chloroflexota bacterium]